MTGAEQLAGTLRAAVQKRIDELEDTVGQLIAANIITEKWRVNDKAVQVLRKSESGREVLKEYRIEL